MQKRDALAKSLAIAGMLLSWFPLVATAVTAGPDQTGAMRLDWLMPAELFPAAFLGAGLLLWASLRAHARRGLVAWGIGAMFAAIVAGTLITMLSGLASGAVEPANAPVAWGLALGAIGLYAASIAEIGVAGILLVADLFRHESGGAAPLAPAA